MDPNKPGWLIEKVLDDLNEKYRDKGRNIHACQLFRRNEPPEGSEHRFGDLVKDADNRIRRIRRHPGYQRPYNDNPGVECQ